MSECKTISPFATFSGEGTVMCDCQISIGESVMTENTNNETTKNEVATPANTFKSRKNFRTFIAEEGKAELEAIIGSNMQFLSVSEESTEEHPDILAVMNVHEKTVIECELKQNIKTLAGLMKHASNYSAKNVICLVNQESNDAIKTVAWLIDIISHEVKLYVIKCYLDRDEIRFKELLRPSANTYQKPQRKMTGSKEKQNEFWQAFDKYVTENNFPIKVTPAPQHWQYVTIGVSGVSIQLTINTAKNNLGCELLIANDKELFKKLEDNKAKIEKQLGKLDWQELEGKKSSRIRTTLEFDITDKENVECGFLWLIDKTNRFKNVFTQYLKGE